MLGSFALLRMTAMILGSRFFAFTSCVFEAVHHGFFQPYSFQMRVWEATLHYFVNLNTEIFSSRNIACKLLQGIQMFVAKAGEHFPFDEAVEIDEVADHSSLRIHLSANGYLHDVVVTVSVGIVAFAVDFLILLR